MEARLGLVRRRAFAVLGLALLAAGPCSSIPRS
jgi:hypothetical protein